MKYVFDMDGTLADNDHRAHLARQARDASREEKEEAWNVFHDGIPYDPPIKPVAEIARALAKDGHVIIIWTARPERYRRQTEEWLNKHRIPFTSIRMRGDDEGYRPAPDIKMEWYQEYARLGLAPPAMVFEDHPETTKKLREAGCVVAQVGEEKH